MELAELLLKYSMGQSYTADTLTTAHRLRLLAQAEQMLVSYLTKLEFVIETIAVVRVSTDNKILFVETRTTASFGIFKTLKSKYYV